MAHTIQDQQIDLPRAPDHIRWLHAQYSAVTGNTSEYSRLGHSLDILTKSLDRLQDYLESEGITEVQSTYGELSAGFTETLTEVKDFVRSLRSVHESELLLIDDDRNEDTTIWLDDTYYMLQYYFWSATILHNVLQ